jgi:hypothetical protein
VVNWKAQFESAVDVDECGFAKKWDKEIYKSDIKFVSLYQQKISEWNIHWL